MRDAINMWARRMPQWVVYAIGLSPIPLLFYAALIGELGVEPIQALEHRYGLISLQYMVAGLTITPLLRLARINLVRFRRTLGLIAFAYLVAHLLVWLVLDVGNLQMIWEDILKRPYITIGMVGFVLLVPLAITSNNASIRHLGSASWKNLHRLVYPAVFLGTVHFMMLSKGFQLEPLLYMLTTLVLLGLRLPIWNKARAT